jgi:hypothetical protein
MYVVKPDEELIKDEEAREEASNVFKAAPDLALSAGSAGKEAKTEGSGSFTNLRGFIDANNEKNKQFATGVAGNLKKEQDDALGAVTADANTWTADQSKYAFRDEDNKLLTRASTNASSLSDKERDTLSNIVKGGYAGGLGFTSDNLAGVQAVADKTQNAVSDQGVVLGDWYKQNKIGNVTQGERTFDQMMLGQDKDAQGVLKTVAADASTLGEKANKIVTDAGATAGDIKGDNEKMGKKYKKKFTDLYGDLTKAVDDRIVTANDEDATAYEAAVNSLIGEGGSVDEYQMNNAFNVMTPEEQANILALADILGIESKYKGKITGRQGEREIHQGTLPPPPDTPVVTSTDGPTRGDIDDAFDKGTNPHGIPLPSGNPFAGVNANDLNPLRDFSMDGAQVTVDNMGKQGQEVIDKGVDFATDPHPIDGWDPLIQEGIGRTDPLSQAGLGTIDKTRTATEDAAAPLVNAAKKKTKDEIAADKKKAEAAKKKLKDMFSTGKNGAAAAPSATLVANARANFTPDTLESEDSGSKLAVLNGMYADLGTTKEFNNAYKYLNTLAGYGNPEATAWLAQMNHLMAPGVTGNVLLNGAEDPATFKDWKEIVKNMMRVTNKGYGTAVMD